MAAALMLGALALPMLLGPSAASASHAPVTCQSGFVPVYLLNITDPSDPRYSYSQEYYWNETFVQVFGGKDANRDNWVCAKFSSGFRNLTVTDNK